MNALLSRNAPTIALVGHFLLFISIVVWNAWIDPPQTLPRILPIVLLGLPLLIVLPGLLKQKSSALYASSLLALVYFSIGVTNVASDQITYGALQVAGSTLWFCGLVLSKKAST